MRTLREAYRTFNYNYIIAAFIKQNPSYLFIDINTHAT